MAQSVCTAIRCSAYEDALGSSRVEPVKGQNDLLKNRCVGRNIWSPAPAFIGLDKFVVLKMGEKVRRPLPERSFRVSTTIRDGLKLDFKQNCG